MDPATYLAHLCRDFGAFEACLAGDLSAPIEHCGGWRLYDLAGHLQLGIASPETRAIAEEAGLLYVEDRCLIIEQRRLQVQAPRSR